MYLEKNYQTYKAFLEGSVQNLLLVGSFFFFKEKLTFFPVLYVYVCKCIQKGAKGQMHWGTLDIMDSGGALLLFCLNVSMMVLG